MEQHATQPSLGAPDFDGLLARLTSADADFAAASDELGFDVDRGLLERISAACAAVLDAGDWKRPLATTATPARVLAALWRARQLPLVAEHAERSGDHLHLLVVRTGESLAFGLTHSASASISRAWPELAGWARTVEKNVERAQQWARSTERLTVRVRPLPVDAAPRGDDDAALLALVRARPDDDAPRLVFADRLLERGDAWGQLIRLQCGPASNEAWRQAIGLINDDWRRMAGELEPWVLTPPSDSFVRGFVEVIEMTVAAFRKDGARLFATWPLRTLRVVAPTAAQLGQLVACAGLSAVPHLELTWNKKQQPTAALGDGRALSALQTLTLRGAGISDEDWLATLERFAPPSLTALELDDVRVGVGLFDALARNPRVALLRRLMVSQGIQALASAEQVAPALASLASRATSLRELSLGKRVTGQGTTPGLDARAIEALFGAGSQLALRALELSWIALDDRVLQRIAGHSTLERLDVRGGAFTRAGVSALLALKLQHLGLACRAVGWDLDWWADQLLSLPASHPLKSLKVDVSALRSPAVARLRERFEVA